jgi:hypothetical protein
MSLLDVLKKREVAKNQAEIFESKARDILEKQKMATKPRVEHRKIPSRIGVNKLSEYHTEVSRLYKNAAEAWSNGDNYSKAIADYKLAYQYAWGDTKREDLKKKINQLYRATGRLETRTVLAVVSVISLIGALLSVSFNLTGYAIGALSYNDLSLVGTALFVLGLVFAFMFVRNKNRKI